MEDSRLERLTQIAHRTYLDAGEEKPYLTPDEFCNLAIRKGTLTDDEFEMMKDHIIWTILMLEQVPFTERLKNVPLYAGQHHEKLDGTGYPDGLTGDELPLQSRILAIADIYEALTAKRPYKQPKPIETVLAILREEAENGKIDPDIVDLVIEKQIYEMFEAQYERVLHVKF